MTALRKIISNSGVSDFEDPDISDAAGKLYSRCVSAVLGRAGSSLGLEDILALLDESVLSLRPSSSSSSTQRERELIEQLLRHLPASAAHMLRSQGGPLGDAQMAGSSPDEEPVEYETFGGGGGGGEEDAAAVSPEGLWPAGREKEGGVEARGEPRRRSLAEVTQGRLQGEWDSSSSSPLQAFADPPAAAIVPSRRMSGGEQQTLRPPPITAQRRPSQSSLSGGGSSAGATGASGNGLERGGFSEVAPSLAAALSYSPQRGLDVQQQDEEEQQQQQHEEELETPVSQRSARKAFFGDETSSVDVSVASASERRRSLQARARELAGPGPSPTSPAGGGNSSSSGHTGKSGHRSSGSGSGSELNAREDGPARSGVGGQQPAPASMVAPGAAHFAGSPLPPHSPSPAAAAPAPGPQLPFGLTLNIFTNGVPTASYSASSSSPPGLVLSPVSAVPNLSPARGPSPAADRRPSASPSSSGQRRREGQAASPHGEPRERLKPSPLKEERGEGRRGSLRQRDGLSEQSEDEDSLRGVRVPYDFRKGSNRNSLEDEWLADNAFRPRRQSFAELSADNEGPLEEEEEGESALDPLSSYFSDESESEPNSFSRQRLGIPPSTLYTDNSYVFSYGAEESDASETRARRPDTDRKHASSRKQTISTIKSPPKSPQQQNGASSKYSQRLETKLSRSEGYDYNFPSSYKTARHDERNSEYETADGIRARSYSDYSGVKNPSHSDLNGDRHNSGGHRLNSRTEFDDHGDLWIPVLDRVTGRVYYLNPHSK